MNTIQKHTSLPEINSINLISAISSITTFSKAKKYTIGRIPLTIPSFPSKNSKKEFALNLRNVISKPSMKNCNIFLSKLSKYTGETKVQLEYSKEELSIKSAKKEWKDLAKKTEEARLNYKQLKGNFYK